VGLGRLVFGDAPSTDGPPAVAGAVPNDKRDRASRTASIVPASLGVTLLDLDAVALANPAVVFPSFERFSADAVDTMRHVEEDPRTYALDSEGVSPPVGLRPQLPRELPAGVDAATIGRMELIILPDGTVESAKLIGQPRSVVDSMLLSAAKAWEFQPAIKDGRPVRYRKTVWIASH
jgi:hypothetical protein